MGTPQETDERLRNWLDSNQLARERLCLAILSLDKRFSNVRPRHPRGGPDAGRDLEALFQGGRAAFGAVGFLNSVSDSPAEKKSIERKFTTDLSRALGADNTLKVFVFLTNVSLTLGEKKALEESANARGIEVVDIFDRERIRIALDSTDGLAARVQYLGLQLSDAEQAAFFARWGEDISGLITKSAAAVESKLGRIEFLQEQNRPLHNLSFHFKLSREVSAAEMPHFRALMIMTFAPITQRPDAKLHMLACNDHGEWEGTERLPGYNAGVGVSWGRKPIYLVERKLFIQYEPFNAVSESLSASSWGPPILGKTLAHLDHALVAFFANRTLAELVSQITVIANEYIIWKIRSVREMTASDPKDTEFPVQFAETELKDPWMQLKGEFGTEWFDFSRFTPRRMLPAEEIAEPPAGFFSRS